MPRSVAAWHAHPLAAIPGVAIALPAFGDFSAKIRWVASCRGMCVTKGTSGGMPSRSVHHCFFSRVFVYSCKIGGFGRRKSCKRAKRAKPKIQVEQQKPPPRSINCAAMVASLAWRRLRINSNGKRSSRGLSGTRASSASSKSSGAFSVHRATILCTATRALCRCASPPHWRCMLAQRSMPPDTAMRCFCAQQRGMMKPPQKITGVHKHCPSVLRNERHKCRESWQKRQGHCVACPSLLPVGGPFQA